MFKVSSNVSKNVHPSLSARTAAGYGRPTQIQERTKIGRPVFGQVEMPIEIRNRKSLLVRLQKAKSNGAPVSRYNVIVEPNARRSRRAPSSTCFKLRDFDLFLTMSFQVLKILIKNYRDSVFRKQNYPEYRIISYFKDLTNYSSTDSTL